MKIKRLVIENFKSIDRIELIEPNPFTVFVGPNGSGKSTIFEALEFVNITLKSKGLAERLFGGEEKFLNRKRRDESVRIKIDLNTLVLNLSKSQPEGFYSIYGPAFDDQSKEYLTQRRAGLGQFLANLSRIFVGNDKRNKLNYPDNYRLSFSANNLEPVLKRILTNSILRNEIFEWLELFVPGFKAVEVDDRNELHWFEESTPDYFTKDLISDGTYNILALLTAVYQSEEPQFLCIEEPENGLHPQIIMSLVDFFRQQCEEKGHYIWLNTHSESLVRQLTTDEIILVNKQNGATHTRQIKGRNIYDIPTDDAWLTGALGGGLPW